MLRYVPLLALTQGKILEAHVGFATRSAVYGPLWKSLWVTAASALSFQNLSAICKFLVNLIDYVSCSIIEIYFSRAFQWYIRVNS